MSYFINEPFYAHVDGPYLNRYLYSWLTVKAINEQGTTYFTQEFPPQLSFMGVAPLEKNIPAEEIKSIILYNASGLKVFEGLPSEVANACLRPGFYISREISMDGSCVIKKFMIK